MPNDHREVMHTLAFDQGWRRGIEVGLGHGLLFKRFLALGIDMIGVDLGLREDRLDRLRDLARLYPDTCRLIIEASIQAAPRVENEWADFIFIDAGHSYRAVQADIAAWLPKLKPGGWFGGHDYCDAFPGVKAAVDQAFDRFDVLEGWIWVAR